VNTGAYVLSREALDLIPANTHFDMTDLIKEMIRNRKKIFTYPVNENDYTDIGQWEEYTKAISKLQHVI
jgi:NDP-sugar pyrophosphorylase family protein